MKMLASTQPTVIILYSVLYWLDWGSDQMTTDSLDFFCLCRPALSVFTFCPPCFSFRSQSSPFCGQHDWFYDVSLLSLMDFISAFRIYRHEDGTWRVMICNNAWLGFRFGFGFFLVVGRSAACCKSAHSTTTFQLHFRFLLKALAYTRRRQTKIGGLLTALPDQDQRPSYCLTYCSHSSKLPTCPVF